MTLHEPWTCPQCVECECCNGGAGKYFQCSKGRRAKHWWDPTHPRPCGHPPKRPDESSSEEDNTMSETRNKKRAANTMARDSDADSDEPPQKRQKPTTQTDTRKPDLFPANPEPEAINEKIQHFRDNYTDQMRTAYDATIERIHGLSGSWTMKEAAAPRSHTTVCTAMSLLAGVYNGALLQKPLLLEEYRSGIQDGTITDASVPFLFLSADEAKQFCADGQPKVSILVPEELDPKRRRPMEMAQSLNRLKTYKDVAVFNFHSKKTGGLLPETMPVDEVLKRFHEEKGILSITDRTIPVANPVPSFLVELPGWDLLPNIREDLKLGKPLIGDDRDLSNQITSLQWAMKGAWFLPRVARAGAVSCTRIEVGDAMRVIWSEQSMNSLKEFGWRGQPTGTSFAVYLRRGDTLIQPAGTPYSTVFGPFRHETLACETIFTPSQNIARQLECMIAEAWTQSAITAEDDAYSVSNKMDRYIQLMSIGNTSFPWPDIAQHATIQKHFKVLLLLALLLWRTR